MPKKQKTHQVAAGRSPRALVKSDKITKLEELFIEAFIGVAQGDAYKAAQMAGYAQSSTGFRVIRRPAVRAAIDKRIMEVQEIEGALTPLEIHRVWRNLAKNADPQVALRATENAAKAVGMFVTRHEVTENKPAQNPIEALGHMDALFSQLPDDVLDALIMLLKRKKQDDIISIEYVSEIAKTLDDAA